MILLSSARAARDFSSSRLHNSKFNNRLWENFNSYKPRRVKVQLNASLFLMMIYSDVSIKKSKLNELKNRIEE